MATVNRSVSPDHASTHFNHKEDALEDGHEIVGDRHHSAASRMSGQKVTIAARYAVKRERKMGLMEAMKRYPSAVGWSLLASTAIVMEGYDLQVVYGFFSLPAFTKKYGSQTGPGEYQISASWQSALSNGNCVGQMIGLLITGIVADRFGYRKSILGGLLLVIFFTFITFFAPDIGVLLTGEVLCGIPWGMFQTLASAYAADLSPVALRPYLTSYINLCWVFGQIVGAGVLRAFLSCYGPWAYRIPFALQWLWPLPLLVGISFAPESPWWLVRNDRLREAEAVCARLMTSDTFLQSDPQHAVALMIHTNEMEKAITHGTSYLDCFRGVDLRRTEICCAVWASQILCGGGLMSYATYFYEQAGLTDSDSFDMTMVQFGLGAIGVALAWILMPWFGRRTLFLVGLTLLFVLLLVIAFVSVVQQDSVTAWAIGSMLLVYTFVYDITIGPVCYALVSEIASTRLRQKTIVLARNAYIICYIINNILTPRMLNPTAWAWKGKTGFLWAGSCLLMLIWAYFRLPEPKGRTYAELDKLFEQGVCARRFASTRVDLFASASESEERHDDAEFRK